MRRTRSRAGRYSAILARPSTGVAASTRLRSIVRREEREAGSAWRRSPHAAEPIRKHIHTWMKDEGEESDAPTPSDTEMRRLPRIVRLPTTTAVRSGRRLPFPLPPSSPQLTHPPNRPTREGTFQSFVEKPAAERMSSLSGAWLFSFIFPRNSSGRTSCLVVHAYLPRSHLGIRSRSIVSLSHFSPTPFPPLPPPPSLSVLFRSVRVVFQTMATVNPMMSTLRSGLGADIESIRAGHPG